LDLKIYFLNVLKTLSPIANFQRIVMYKKFLNSPYIPRKLTRRFKSFYYNLFNLYFYSIYYRNLILFLNFLNRHFKTVKDQRFIVRLLNNLIKRCFLRNLDKNITGLKFLLTGKLTKRPRSRTTLIVHRKTSGTQTLDTKIYYAARQLFNTFGAFGAKI